MREPVSAESVREQLGRILSSAGFVRNERQSRFLRFVVEQQLQGKSDQLKESVVGVEVFDRRPDYNARRDPIVRVEAAKLRARLAEYYAAEDGAAPLIIELPKGGYVPAFRAQREHDRRRLRSPRLPIALACLAVILGAAGWWWLRHKSEPITIAVLPLEDLSRDPGGDYFADGLTDELIRNLSIIDGLAPRSRTSSFAVRSKPLRAQEVGKQLGADYILEGSVLRAGKHLRINVQLIRARDDFALWSGRYDRELTDIFVIQDDISRQVVNNLRLRLGRGRRKYETSAEAYDFYLRARALTLRRGAYGTFQSIEPLEQAIARDPSFAPAYASLAAAYAVRSNAFSVNHPVDELPKMRSAAEKAIQLDPLLAEAYDALGMVSARDSQWEKAENSFHQALRLDPSRATTYIDLSVWVFAVLGRTEEALGNLKVAEKLDPLSPEVHRELALVLMAAGRYDEAVEHCLKLPAGDWARRQRVARARIAQGRLDEAIGLLTGDTTSPNPGYLGYALARAGRRAEAESLAASRVGLPQEQAVIFAGLGDKDRTLEALDRMTSLGAQRIGLCLNSPEFALLRGDSRVKALRAKVGLPE